jgi:hypothetical protein
MGTMAQQMEFTLQRLSQIPDSLSQGKNKPRAWKEQIPKTSSYKQKEYHPIRYTNPNTFFPTFNEEDVHMWPYRCTQYFEIEDIAYSRKLQITSYYIDGIALYWHQKNLRSLGNQRATWEEYVEAICYKFEGQQGPLKDLME